MHENPVARVIAAHGRHVLLDAGSDRQLPARVFGRDVVPVCGDRVQYRLDPHHDEAHVLAVLARKGTLWRTNAQGGAEAVAANLTHLLVVLAPVPTPDLFVVDRYLCAATSVGLDATVVVNKADLALHDELRSQLLAYPAAGYPVIHCSADQGEGVRSLQALLPQDCLACLVGQSGVGKSSLVRWLLPNAGVTVGSLARDEEGRHTTTAAKVYRLESGGALIDSPGVRDFAPAVAALDARTLGFLDVERLAASCRFADCLHLREPQCSVRTAAHAGDLDPRRYESYRRLRRLREQLRERRGPKRHSH